MLFRCHPGGKKYKLFYTTSNSQKKVWEADHPLQEAVLNVTTERVTTKEMGGKGL